MLSDCRSVGPCWTESPHHFSIHDYPSLCVVVTGQVAGTLFRPAFGNCAFHPLDLFGGVIGQFGLAIIQAFFRPHAKWIEISTKMKRKHVVGELTRIDSLTSMASLLCLIVGWGGPLYLFPSSVQLMNLAQHHHHSMASSLTLLASLPTRHCNMDLVHSYDRHKAEAQEQEHEHHTVTSTSTRSRCSLPCVPRPSGYRIMNHGMD